MIIRLEIRMPTVICVLPPAFSLRIGWQMIPGIEATAVIAQRASMYCTFTLSMMRALIVAVRVVNMVRYMAVEEATAECMSS